MKFKDIAALILSYFSYMTTYDAESGKESPSCNNNEKHPVHKVSVKSCLQVFTLSVTKEDGISIMSLRGESETISDPLTGSSIPIERKITLLELIA